MNNTHGNPSSSKVQKKRGRTVRKSDSLSVSSSNIAPEESYIIKLLGRRVNLTAFRVDVPLYSLCRAWIQDDPDAQMSASQNFRGPNNTEASWNCKSSGSNDSRVTEAEIQDIETEFLNNYNDLSDSGEENELQLPPPVPLPAGVHTLRIPSPIPFAKQEIDLNYESKTLPTKEQLLKENSVRWQAVRRKWKSAAMKDERRYIHSKNMLQAMAVRYQRPVKSS